MINIRSITFKLMVWYTVLLSVVAFAFCAYTYWGLKHHLITSLQNILMQRAQQVGSTLVFHMDDTAASNLSSDIKIMYEPEVNNRFMRISTEDGKILYVSGLPRDASFAPESVPLFSKERPANRIESNDYGRLYIATSSAMAQKTGKHYVVEVGSAGTFIHSALSDLLLTLIFGFPAFLVIGIYGGRALLKRSLLPVTTIMHSAEEISLHNLSKRLPIAPTGDELEGLGHALNRMITRLDTSFQQTSRFTADASHELRTPLTIIRGELEAILQAPRLPKDIREQVAVVLEETEYLIHITKSLLAIARLEAGEAKITADRIYLGELVSSIVEQMHLLATEKNITMSAHVDPYVVISGDATRMKQMIINLIDNAIKYTAEGGSVTVTVAQENALAIITVHDTGVGIAPEHLPYIYERFYRADKIRSRAIGGAGLGLSIVRSICLAHGGTVTVKSIQGEGTTFTIALPAERHTTPIHAIAA